MVCDAMRMLWEDPNAERFGRSGQWQHGVDVYGKRGNKIVGAQAKNMERLSESLALEEIAKAELFKPPLQELYFAIAGDRDSKATEFALKLSEERIKRNTFPVFVKFFDDIVDLLGTSKPEKDGFPPRLVLKYWNEFFISSTPSSTKPATYVASNWWRLLISVRADFGDPGMYEVYTSLILPDGSFRSTASGALRELSGWPDDSTAAGRLFRASELADLILDWYQSSAVIVDQKSCDGFVVLSLPVELLAGKGAQALLCRITATCDKEGLDQVPILLACSGRQGAAASRNRKMKQALRKAKSKSMEIVSCLEERSEPLARLRWLWVRNPDAKPPGSINFSEPQIGKASEHNVCDSADFDTSANFQSYSNRGEDWLVDRQALLLSCPLDPAHEMPWRPYADRMLCILHGGIPFVVIDSSHLYGARQPPIDLLGKRLDHPLDTMLSWNWHDFSRNYIRMHEPLPKGSNGRQIALRDYLLQSIIFWEDHRYPPPDGSRPEDGMISIFIPDSQ